VLEAVAQRDEHAVAGADTPATQSAAEDRRLSQE
jgi:hypothetical protein